MQPYRRHSDRGPNRQGGRTRADFVRPLSTESGSSPKEAALHLYHARVTLKSMNRQSGSPAGFHEFSILAETLHLLIDRYFLQPETGLYYTYIDPYEVGRINLPSRRQIDNDVPNSNGWCTPIEDSCMYGSRLLIAEIDRYSVAACEATAGRARRLFEGLMLLSEASSVPGFIPRGVLPDGQTHYRDSSIDQQSHWITALWRYRRSPIASPVECGRIDRTIEAYATAVYEAGWRLEREDGRLTSWGDLLSGDPPRGPFCAMLIAAIASDITGLSEWRDRYRRLRDDKRRSTAARLADGALFENPPWVTSQTTVVLDALRRLESDRTWRRRYAAALSRISRDAADLIRNRESYSIGRGRTDLSHRLDTFRNIVTGAVCVSYDPGAASALRGAPVCIRALLSLPYHSEAKELALIEPVITFQAKAAERRILDVSEPAPPDIGVGVDPIPPGEQVRFHTIGWYDAGCRTYNGLPSRPGVPESQHRFVVG